MKYSHSFLCWSIHPGSQKVLSLLFSKIDNPPPPPRRGKTLSEAHDPQRRQAQGLGETAPQNGAWGAPCPRLLLEELRTLNRMVRSKNI